MILTGGARRAPGTRATVRNPIAPGEPTSDGEVVRAVLRGEVEQYAQLVRRYRERYARYATQLLGAVDPAEDAMQEAFIRAYDQLASCRDPDNFAGWFFMILRNCCYAEARAGRRNAGEALGPAQLNQAGTDRADGPLEEAERRRRMERALERLTTEQREVFVLKHDEGLSYDEIARKTGLSIASLKMRMHRAYDRLRAELAGET